MDGDTEGWQKTFFSCFLMKQNDVVLKQKDGVLKESPLRFFSRTKLEWEKKNSMDFPEGHQPFAEGETKLPKKIFFSEIHHPSNDLEAKQNTSLNSPETQIFEAFVCFYIANLPCFSIFCYLTKLIFFPFCWILNAGNGVFNRWFNWFINLYVKKC